MTDGRRVGMVMWAAQPVLIVVELVVALVAASAALPLEQLLRDRSISELGADRTSWTIYGGPVPVLSPAWFAMDVAFVMFGIMLAAGAVLLRSSLPRVVTALWVTVGITSAAAGAVPLNLDEEAHVALSASALLLQPVALMLLAPVMTGRWRWSTVVVGLVSVVGAVGYLSRPSNAVGAGLFERLAVWPAYVWLPVVALLIAGHPRQSGPRIADRTVR